MLALGQDGNPRDEECATTIAEDARIMLLEKLGQTPLCHDQVRHQGQQLLVELEG